jgi:uncharacterized membrane protein
MTGQGSRHPANRQGNRSPAAAGAFPAALIRPGHVNICICQVLILTGLLAPVALAFAIRFSETEGRWLQSHYHYIRTTIAVLVIGCCLGSLMILLGAPLSSLLMLAGLGVIAATLVLCVSRCVTGFYCSWRGYRLRDHATYLI